MTEEATEKRRETSWSGTEDRRREQGVCLPPTRAPNTMPRYWIPAGTAIRVSKLSPLSWRQWTTRVSLSFERHEGYRNGWYTFRERGWLVCVHRRHVVHRADLASV
jgi:hypothetical protein